MAYDVDRTEKALTENSVSGAHVSLDKELEILGERITALESALTPVLTNYPTDGSVLAKALNDGMSPALSKVRNLIDTVIYIRSRIETITSRLEV